MICSNGVCAWHDNSYDAAMALGARPVNCFDVEARSWRRGSERSSSLVLSILGLVSLELSSMELPKMQYCQVLLLPFVVRIPPLSSYCHDSFIFLWLSYRKAQVIPVAGVFWVLHWIDRFHLACKKDASLHVAACGSSIKTRRCTGVPWSQASHS